MSEDTNLAAKLAFLEKFGADNVDHSEEDLMSHLTNTHQILVEWEASQSLCDAGLFHSIYGTEAFQTQVVPDEHRQEVAALIGAEAEKIVWHFCTMKRATLSENLSRDGDLQIQNRVTEEWYEISEQEFHDLANLTVANAMEHVPRIPPKYYERSLEHGRMMLLPFAPVLLPKGKSALEELLSGEQAA